MRSPRHFGFRAQAEDRDGIVYRSARARGTFWVVFRRAVVVACVRAGQTLLVWDGATFQPGPGCG